MTFGNFPDMLGLSEGRDRAGPNPFLAKIKLGYFSKFCLHGVAYDLEILFQTYLVHLRGEAGPHSFSVNFENVCIFWYRRDSSLKTSAVYHL